MTAEPTPVDSSSLGDSTRFLTLDALERGLAALEDAPRDTGRVALLVRRVEAGRREILGRVELSPEGGVAGDAWARRPERDPEMQIAVMQAGVAQLIANGQPLTLFGDSLFFELDLSSHNLPAGSRLFAGGTLLEVTAMPHNGCRKFQARFGADALRFVSKPELRPRKLRGIYLRVVESGEVRPGDPVRVLFRAPAPSPA
jgi:MOSC domain-containing protein YiiM